MVYQTPTKTRKGHSLLLIHLRPTFVDELNGEGTTVVLAEHPSPDDHGKSILTPLPSNHEQDHSCDANRVRQGARPAPVLDASPHRPPTATSRSTVSSTSNPHPLTQPTALSRVHILWSRDAACLTGEDRNGADDPDDRETPEGASTVRVPRRPWRRLVIAVTDTRSVLEGLRYLVDLLLAHHD